MFLYSDFISGRYLKFFYLQKYPYLYAFYICTSSLKANVREALTYASRAPTNSFTLLIPCLSRYALIPSTTFSEIEGSIKLYVPI